MLLGGVPLASIVVLLLLQAKYCGFPRKLVKKSNHEVRLFRFLLLLGIGPCPAELCQLRLCYSCSYEQDIAGLARTGKTQKANEAMKLGSFVSCCCCLVLSLVRGSFAGLGRITLVTTSRVCRLLRKLERKTVKACS